MEKRYLAWSRMPTVWRYRAGFGADGKAFVESAGEGSDEPRGETGRKEKQPL